MGVVMRVAEERDVPAIVAMLADDPLGARRESPGDLPPYREAFARIDADPHQMLTVAEDDQGAVIATMQLTFLPGLARRGAIRCQIEAVRVHANRRGTGLGTTMIEWAIETARARGAALVQLTSDNTRTGAHRFYERLGFHPTHVGFKLDL